MRPQPGEGKGRGEGRAGAGEARAKGGPRHATRSGAKGKASRPRLWGPAFRAEPKGKKAKQRGQGTRTEENEGK